MRPKNTLYYTMMMFLQFTWLLSSCQSGSSFKLPQGTSTLDSTRASFSRMDMAEIIPLPALQVTETAETPQNSWYMPVEKTPLPMTATPKATPEFKICSPLVPYPLSELREIVSDPYRPPPPGKDERHHGVDFSHYRRGDLLTIEGVEVQSVLPGRVAATLADTYPYGNLIILETPRSLIPDEWITRLEIGESDSLYILYAHLQSPPSVELDDWVTACQVIGAVGKTGNTVEPHLHLETRLGVPFTNFPVMRYYQVDATEEEKEAYLRWRISGEFRHFDPMRLLNP
jgi:murein DD-endopeptidase MepM/ murein hydrolase activator NlpD